MKRIKSQLGLRDVLLLLSYPVKNHAASFCCRVIERLQESIKKQDALIGELQEKHPDQPVLEQVAQLNTLIGQKDAEVQVCY